MSIEIKDITAAIGEYKRKAEQYDNLKRDHDALKAALLRLQESVSIQVRNALSLIGSEAAIMPSAKPGRKSDGETGDRIRHYYDRIVAGEIVSTSLIMRELGIPIYKANYITERIRGFRGIRKERIGKGGYHLTYIKPTEEEEHPPVVTVTERIKTQKLGTGIVDEATGQVIKEE